jgi:hypothetical protein
MSEYLLAKIGKATDSIVPTIQNFSPLGNNMGLQMSGRISHRDQNTDRSMLADNAQEDELMLIEEDSEEEIKKESETSKAMIENYGSFCAPRVISKIFNK